MLDIDDERARIARELHDGVAQDLIAMGYLIDNAIGRSGTSSESRSELRSIRSEITRINENLREEIFSLRSKQPLNMTDNLKLSLENLFPNAAIKGTLPATQAGLELIKVIKELSFNAFRHGSATNISITISESEILFSDDGIGGFDEEIDRFGLKGIRERLHKILATIEFDSPTKTAKILLNPQC